MSEQNSAAVGALNESRNQYPESPFQKDGLEDRSLNEVHHPQPYIHLNHDVSRIESPVGIYRSQQPKRGATHLPAKDTPEPWNKVNMLSFDGGGIRGYWSLLALERLMDHIASYENQRNQTSSFHPLKCPPNTSRISLTVQQRESLARVDENDDPTRHLPNDRRFLPCHYFDYIFGSSTGSLIAIMLGRFRMSVSDCKKEFEMLGDKVFGKPRSFTQIRTGFLTTRSKYNTRKVEKIFKKVCRERNGEIERDNGTHDSVLFPMAPGVCKTYIVTYRYVNRGLRDIFPIRSYRLPTSDTDSSVPSQSAEMSLHRNLFNDFEVWQVARAAVAAPLFFDPLPFEHYMGQQRSSQWLLEDGGYNDYNNPTELGISELEHIHQTDSIQNVVSIGTSRAFKKLGTKRNLIAKIKNFASWGADPEPVHRRVATRHRAGHFQYYRFNDPGALDVELDDWQPRSRRFRRRREKPGSRTLKEIRDKFERWAYSNDKQFKECARKLVEIRIARAHGQHESCVCVLANEGKVCHSIKRGKDEHCESIKTSSISEPGLIRQVRESLWERYALRGEYHCEHDACISEKRGIYQYRHHLEQHLSHIHSEIDESVSRVVNKRRVRWFYPVIGKTGTD